MCSVQVFPTISDHLMNTITPTEKMLKYFIMYRSLDISEVLVRSNLLIVVFATEFQPNFVYVSERLLIQCLTVPSHC